MEFNSLQIAVASDAAALAIEPYVPAISYFAKDFSAAPGMLGNAVAIPVFEHGTTKDGTVLTADAWSTDTPLDGVTLNLNKDIVKTYALQDTAAAGTSTFLKNGAEAIAHVLGVEVNKYVFGELTKTKIDTANGEVLSATTPTAKAGFAGLFATAQNLSCDPYDCALVLNPATYSSLLSTMDYNVIGSSEAAKYGVLESVYGFRAVINSPFLDTTNGIKGLIIPRDCFGVAARWNKPIIDGYNTSWVATDAKTSLPMGFRIYEDTRRGAAVMGGDCMLGARILQKGIIELV